MKSMESTGPLCPDCLRPISLLLFNGQTIVMDGCISTAGGIMYLMERHSCVPPAQRPQARIPNRQDRSEPVPASARDALGLGRRGPMVSMKQRDAMRWVIETLEAGPRTLHDLNEAAYAAGYSRSNVYRALKKTGAERYDDPGGRAWVRYVTAADVTS